MNDQIIPVEATRSDFVAANEVHCGPLHDTESGKRYVECAAGVAREGMTAVRFIIVYGDGPRGRKPVVGYRKEIVGKISGVGQAFSRLSGDPLVQRAYIEG